MWLGVGVCDLFWLGMGECDLFWLSVGGCDLFLDGCGCVTFFLLGVGGCDICLAGCGWLSREKLVQKLEKHPRPENVNYLKIKQCNPEIWSEMLLLKTRSKDLKQYRVAF